MAYGTSPWYQNWLTSGRSQRSYGLSDYDWQGLDFSDPTYRNSGGLAFILDALRQHDAGIADRSRQLYNQERVGQPISSMSFEGGDYQPASDEGKKGGFVDWLKGRFTGADGKVDWGRAGASTLALLGNPVAGGLAMAAKYGLSKLSDVDWKSLFGDSDPAAARASFFQNLSDSGINDAQGLAGREDARSGRPGGAVPPDLAEPGMDGGAHSGWGGGSGDASWMRGMGGGGYGGGGAMYGGPTQKAPGGFMGDPNTGMPQSWMMPVAGSNFGIPVIQGPSYVGRPYTPEDYPPIRF